MDKAPAQLSAEEQQDTPLYACSECGETVIIFNGRPFWTCTCENRQIVVTEEGLRRGL